MPPVTRNRPARWVIQELQANFAKASRAGELTAQTEPRAARAVYQSAKKSLVIDLTSGATITIPVKLIPELRRATPRGIRAVEVLGRGGGLHWERLDLDLSVPGLIASVLRRSTS
jgi:hypothetical protein